MTTGPNLDVKGALYAPRHALSNDVSICPMTLMQTRVASEKVLWVDCRLILDMNRGHVQVTLQLLDSVCYQNSAFAEVA